MARISDKKRVQVLRDLRKIVTSNEDYGLECKDFQEECMSCQVHRALNVLEGAYEDLLLNSYEK